MERPVLAVVAAAQARQAAPAGLEGPDQHRIIQAAAARDHLKQITRQVHQVQQAAQVDLLLEDQPVQEGQEDQQEVRAEH
jgi:hypothetical protein